MAINYENALTNLTISRCSTQAEPFGPNVISGSSAEGAIEWMKKNALN